MPGGLQGEKSPADVISTAIGWLSSLSVMQERPILTKSLNLLSLLLVAVVVFVLVNIPETVGFKALLVNMLPFGAETKHKLVLNLCEATFAGGPSPGRRINICMVENDKHLLVGSAPAPQTKGDVGDVSASSKKANGQVLKAASQASGVKHDNLLGEEANFASRIKSNRSTTELSHIPVIAQSKTQNDPIVLFGTHPIDKKMEGYKPINPDLLSGLLAKPAALSKAIEESKVDPLAGR